MLKLLALFIPRCALLLLLLLRDCTIAAAMAEESLPRAPQPLFVHVDYPVGATAEATVAVDLVVDPVGRVASTTVIAGEEPFVASLLQQVESWVFVPVVVAGTPVAARVRYSVTFVPPETGASVSRPAAPKVDVPSVPPHLVQDGDVVEIVVLGERPHASYALSSESVRQTPGSFGDAFRAVDVLPGVVPALSGLPYYAIRGAPVGSTSNYLGGVALPYLFHFGVGPGVVHPMLLRDITLYPGAAPAQYAASVGPTLAAELAEPGSERRIQASARLTDVGAVIQLPVNDRASVSLSGRYSYAGALVSLLSDDQYLGYWDYQLFSHLQMTQQDSIEVIGIGASDVLGSVFRTKSGKEARAEELAVGFHRLETRWRASTPSRSIATALTLGYDWTRLDDGDVNLSATRLGLKTDGTATWGPALARYGASSEYATLGQRLVGDEWVPSGPDDHKPAPDFNLDGHDRVTLAAYASVAWSPVERIELVPGVRVEGFLERQQSALGINPSVDARFHLSERFNLLHSLAFSRQPPTVFGALPAAQPTLEGGLQSAIEHAAGLELTLTEQLHGSVTFFQNALFNVSDVLGTQLQEATSVNRRSMGRALGAEFLVRGTVGSRLSGLISYTLSRSERQREAFAGVTAQDRTHVANLALAYELSTEWQLGSRVLAYSGNVFEPERSHSRAPPFWRADLRVEKRWPRFAGSRYWSLVAEVQNATLNTEVVDERCYPMEGCRPDIVGPVTIPSIGLEAHY